MSRAVSTTVVSAADESVRMLSIVTVSIEVVSTAVESANLLTNSESEIFLNPRQAEPT